METFVQKVDRALKNLDNAKKFSKTNRHQLMQFIGEDGIGLMWFTVAGVGILLVVLYLKVNDTTLQSMYAAPVVLAAYVFLVISTPVVLLYWSHKSSKICLTHDLIDCSAEFIVGVVQNCQSAGASSEQLEMLQVLAKDTTVPENWWNWLNCAAVEELRKIKKRQTIKAMHEKRAAAQHKIDSGRILE